MSKHNSSTSVEVALEIDAACLLGEGPVWHDGKLHFVDIKGGALHQFDPVAKHHQQYPVQGMPSFILPSETGFLVGDSQTIYHSDGKRLLSDLIYIDEPAGNRTNDATLDAKGRLWFGTMDNQENLATGRVYCLNGTELIETSIKAVITNGPTITQDCKTIYSVDTAAQQVWRFDILADGSLTSGECVIQLTDGEGYPDGVVLDSAGYLWLALWDGWCVRRYSPDGELVLTVEIPCARVTKVAFGGEDLTRVYVTTARTGLNEAELVKQPHAGGVFSFQSMVKGVPCPLFSAD